MKIKNIYSLLITASIVATLFTINGCRSEQTEEDTEIPPVRILKTELTEMDREIRYTGIVEPWEEAHVGIGGAMKIERIFVDVDDYVQKGQLIAQMDETQLYQTKIRVNTLKKDMERLDTLRQLGAVTQQNYEQLKAEYDIAKKSLENLSENTKIVSPLAGKITGRYYSEGEIFMMSPGPAGKPAIVSIYQIQPVKVIVNISQQFFPVIERKMQATITADIYPDEKFTGYIERVHPVIDRATGTFKAEIRIPNENITLRPGMTVKADLNFGRKEVIIVPSQAVLRQSGTNDRYIFVEENSTAIRKQVQIAERIDDTLVISEGLKPGENIIIAGQHNLLHKQEVRIVE